MVQFANNLCYTIADMSYQIDSIAIIFFFILDEMQIFKKIRNVIYGEKKLLKCLR